MNDDIIYEDNSFLLLNKQAGIVVNRADTTRHFITVQDWFETRQGLNIDSEEKKEIEFYKRGGVVHRLDKETSGILILAKTQDAFTKLQSQFKERTVKKVYRALAHGRIEPQTGEVNEPVGRLPWNRTRFGILPEGREATTQYKVLNFYRNNKTKEVLSYVELYPLSGRTHQIRVHLKHINHPIFADFLYAGRKTARNDRKLLNRVFLHAAQISFIHPETNKRLNFDAALPEELQTCLDSFERI